MGSGGYGAVMALVGGVGSIRVTRVEAVRTERLEGDFEAWCERMEHGREHGGDVINVRFPEDGEKEGVYGRLRTRFVARAETGLRHTDVVDAWHGCRREAADSICRLGPRDLRLVDGGYYGAGAYVTTEAEYAAGYSCRTWNKPEVGAGRGRVEDEEYVMVLCRVGVGCVYPISRATDYVEAEAAYTREPMCRFHHLYPNGRRSDKGMEARYDAHVVTVAYESTFTSVKGVMYGQAARGGESRTCQEVVVRSGSQVVPVALVYFRPTEPRR